MNSCESVYGLARLLRFSFNILPIPKETCILLKIPILPVIKPDTAACEAVILPLRQSGGQNFKIKMYETLNDTTTCAKRL